MEITFGPAKNERNIHERGLSFEMAAEFDLENAETTEDTRQEYGESRFRSFGFIRSEMYALVFTIRDEALRVISLRKANRRERTLYEKVSKSRED